jgi:hypothetical protein
MNEPHDMPIPTTTTNYKSAVSPLTYRSVDTMKWNKDTMRVQPTDAVISGIVNCLAGLNITHIAVAMPMDETADYVAAGVSPPSPNTAAVFTKKWFDAIHAAGLNVIFRGTYCGIEGIYDFPSLVGPTRFPTGTAASAATDGQTTWLGKVYDWITNHSDYWADGDIFAPLPERTEDIFADATSFLPYVGGITTNYATFYNDLLTVSNAAFTAIGKTVTSGMTSNNYTEVASGWIPNSVFTNANITAVDHYGSTHTSAEMDANLRSIYTSKGENVFLQEWGDYWNDGMDEATRAAYLVDFYSVLATLASEGKLTGFNYWGGWTGTGEGIMTQAGNIFTLNSRGQLLKDFFDSTSSVTTMMQEAIDAIRLIDSNKWIFCGFDSWSGGQSFVSQYGANPDTFLTDTANKLVYSFHYYFDDDHSGTYPIDFKSSNNTDITTNLTAIMAWGVAKSVNLHCGEYGVPNIADWQVCLTTFLDLCNTYDVWAHHWAAGNPYTSATTCQPAFSPTVDKLQMATISLINYLGTLK